MYGCHQSRIGSQDTNTLKASCRPSALYKSTLPRISLSAMSASFRRKWVSSTLAYMFEITNPKCSLTIYDPSSRSGVSSLTTGNSWNQNVWPWLPLKEYWLPIIDVHIHTQYTCTVVSWYIMYICVLHISVMIYHVDSCGYHHINLICSQNGGTPKSSTFFSDFSSINHPPHVWNLPIYGHLHMDVLSGNSLLLNMTHINNVYIYI